MNEQPTIRRSVPHYSGIGQLDIEIADYLRLYRSVSDYVELIGRMTLQSEPGGLPSR